MFAKWHPWGTAMHSWTRGGFGDGKRYADAETGPYLEHLFRLRWFMRREVYQRIQKLNLPKHCILVEIILGILL
jgi:hypothetical protein